MSLAVVWGLVAPFSGCSLHLEDSGKTRRREHPENGGSPRAPPFFFDTGGALGLGQVGEAGLGQANPASLLLVESPYCADLVLCLVGRN